VHRSQSPGSRSVAAGVRATVVYRGVRRCRRSPVLPRALAIQAETLATRPTLARNAFASRRPPTTLSLAHGSAPSPLAPSPSMTRQTLKRSSDRSASPTAHCTAGLLRVLAPGVPRASVVYRLLTPCPCPRRVVRSHRRHAATTTTDSAAPYRGASTGAQRVAFSAIDRSSFAGGNPRHADGRRPIRPSHRREAENQLAPHRHHRRERSLGPV